MSKLSDIFRRRARSHNAKNPPEALTTPLHAAMDARHLAALRDLLSENADIYAPDGLGRSALVYAVEKNDRAAAELILSFSTDGIDQTSAFGTALMIAAQNGDRDMAALLLAHGADINAADKEGTTPLMAAQFQKQHDMMAFLLAGGADAAARRINDENALHLAAMQDDIVALDMLLAHGAAADINRQKKIGKDTPLMKAVRARSHAAAQKLLAAGADPHIPDSLMQTPLHAAVMANDLRMIHILTVEGHADINKVSHTCLYTPLHTAAFEQNAAAARALIRLGADPHQPDDQGRTPLCVAGWNGGTEAARYFLEEVEPETDATLAAQRRAAALYDAIFYQHRDTAHYLLDSGKVDVNICVRGADFMLHAAVRNRDMEMVEKLLAAGADPDAVTPAGAHALMCAVGGGNAEMVARLLQAGANPNLPASDELPLMKAIESDKPELVSLLLAHGADPRLQDRYARNALDLAQLRGRTNLSPLLQAALEGYGNTPAAVKKAKGFQGPRAG